MQHFSEGSWGGTYGLTWPQVGSWQRTCHDFQLAVAKIHDGVWGESFGVYKCALRTDSWKRCWKRQPTYHRASRFSAKFRHKKKQEAQLAQLYFRWEERCILPGLKTTWFPLELGVFKLLGAQQKICQKGGDPFLILGHEWWRFFQFGQKCLGPIYAYQNAKILEWRMAGNLISSLGLSHSPRFIPFMQIENSKVPWLLRFF